MEILDPLIYKADDAPQVAMVCEVVKESLAKIAAMGTDKTKCAASAFVGHLAK